MPDNDRVFLRSVVSKGYDMSDHRRLQRSGDRVRKAGVRTKSGHTGSDNLRARWILGPGDEEFLTQTLEIHFVEVLPGKSNTGHGHQNEACFYILDGQGYEIHDGRRYDWSAGDFVVVHADCVHQHWNSGDKDPFLAIVFKAKTAWMYLGLVQQSRGGPFDGGDAYGPRVDWSQLWRPGVERLKKVVKPDDGPWIWTPEGYTRIVAGPQRPDVRLFSVDVALQDIPVGSRSGKVWHMSDECTLVVSGTGHALQWDVEAEIGDRISGDRYYAHIANEPSRWEFGPGDLIYAPPNTIRQIFNTSASQPLKLVSAQNALVQALGYRRSVVLEAAPEYAASGASR